MYKYCCIPSASLSLVFVSGSKSQIFVCSSCAYYVAHVNYAPMAAVFLKYFVAQRVSLYSATDDKLGDRVIKQ